MYSYSFVIHTNIGMSEEINLLHSNKFTYDELNTYIKLAITYLDIKDISDNIDFIIDDYFIKKLGFIKVIQNIRASFVISSNDDN